MKRILLTLILLCKYVSYAQSFGDIPDAKLWLRPNPLNDSVNKISFNFNPVIRFDENIEKEFRNVYKKTFPYL